MSLRMLTKLSSSLNEGQRSSSARELVAKQLDDSRGTAATRPEGDSDAEDGDITWGDIMAAPTPVPVGVAQDRPIIINEDDAPHVKETHFHGCLIRDSIQVQKHHKANDDEVHEENPHLQDFLIPHHSFHVDRPEEADKAAGEASGDDAAGPQEAAPEVAVGEEEEVKPVHGILHAEEAASPLSPAASGDELQGDKPKRSVSFGTVLVRDYDMILGDHPCCTYGPPLTIDWDYLEYEPLDVNDYEFHHPPRRSLREMGLNYYQRKKVLSDAGYTEADFKLSKKQLSKAKINRSVTRQIATNFPLMKAEDAVESACRKFKRLLKQDHWVTMRQQVASLRKSDSFRVAKE